MAQYRTISVEPSSNYRGNDGAWSTFYVDLGSPPITLELLPSTSTGFTWAVLPGGCPSYQPFPVSTWLIDRGGAFDFGTSTTSQFVFGSYVASQYGLTLGPEEQLGGNYSSSGHYHTGVFTLDDIRLSDEILGNQLIISYNSSLPYVGLLGLTNLPTLLGTNSGSFASLLGTLSKTTSPTTSSYWAYTAGSHNYFGATGYPGLLTIGGYDAARGNVDNVLTIDLRATPSQTTVVNLEGIYVNQPLKAPGSINSLGLSMYIDSVVPEIWLPQQGYQLFESAFGLQWNEKLSLYMISDSQHQILLQQNATVDLELSYNSNSINISLPYFSFDHSVSYPLAEITNGASLRYFPLRRASATDQYTPGRVFLQAAYLAVDYNRTQFTILQARFPENQYARDIKTVYPKWVKDPNIPFITYVSKAPLSTGAIAGIAIGGAALLAIIIAFLWWFFYYRPRAQERKSRRLSGRTKGGDANPEFTGYYDAGEEKKRAEEEMYEKRELEAADVNRASTTSRHEMPSPPPLPQYSPGSRSPVSPGSPGSHMRNISAESAELPVDYLTARRLSPVSGGPWELPRSNEHQRESFPTSPGSPLEMGIGSLRGPNPATNF